VEKIIVIQKQLVILGIWPLDIQVEKAQNESKGKREQHSDYESTKTLGKF
jgi:hypothetical protein